jgi:hypothetical protein
MSHSHTPRRKEGRDASRLAVAAAASALRGGRLRKISSKIEYSEEKQPTIHDSFTE